MELESHLHAGLDTGSTRSQPTEWRVHHGAIVAIYTGSPSRPASPSQWHQGSGTQILAALAPVSILGLVHHASRRYSAERACAVRLSECARVDATPAIALDP